MIEGILNPANYAFKGIFLLFPLLSATIVLHHAWLLFKEGLKMVHVTLALLGLAIVIWLTSYFFFLSALHEDLALWWARKAYLGVPLIAAALYHFTVTLCSRYNEKRVSVWLGWAAASIFSVLFTQTDLFISGLLHYSWGVYPAYTGLIILYFIYFFPYLGLSLAELMFEWKRVSPYSIQHRRIRALFFAFVFGIFGSIDYLASFGIPVYPIGGFAVAPAFLVISFTVSRYRLIDITPGFAAEGVINTMNDSLIVLDEAGVIRLVNNSAVALLGLNEQAVRGHDVLEIFPQERFRKAFAFGGHQGSVSHFEFPYERHDGQELTIEASVSLMVEHEIPIARIVILRDITQQRAAVSALNRAYEETELRVKQRTAELTEANNNLAIEISERRLTEEALRQSEQFIRSILDTVDEGFIVIDREYRILTANKAFCSQVGGCDETVIGRHCYEISHKTDRPCYEEGEDCATRHAFETGTFHTALHRHKDDKGNILYVETKAFPIKDAEGNVTSVIEVINNITEKYLLEEERLKTQKLESIGTLAGGIAHDFNNLLQGVFGYISMAKLTHDQKDKSLAMLEQAEEALHLSVNLTTQLLTFSKGGKPVKKLMRVEPAIENAVKFALSGSHSDYRLDIAPDLWSVEADAGQLAQVIQNIVLNANEAMAGKGTVQVSVRNMEIPPKTDLKLPDGGKFIRIDIQDTGIGIPEQNISKIFDPYFTTKQRGSGLGLATSYSIIKNHGGLIELQSEQNRGTTFSIYLPASGAAEAEVNKTPPTVATTRKMKILIMDDENIVRSVAKEMIAALGHEVEGAVDGNRAIELFSKAMEQGRPFDLVILDLTVKGGMGGQEAITRIREIDPTVKAVVSSGYADSPVVADYRAHGFSAVMNKPYRIDSLRACLTRIISDK